MTVGVKRIEPRQAWHQDPHQVLDFRNTLEQVGHLRQFHLTRAGVEPGRQSSGHHVHHDHLGVGVLTDPLADLLDGFVELTRGWFEALSEP